jgi:ACS family hexuronate transporter-like MFS transporter
LNYLDRQTMSILAPILQKEMHLDNEALGWLFSVFYYAYTLSQFVVGPLLDCISAGPLALPFCSGLLFAP